MPAYTPYDIIELTPAAAVATDGTMTFTYPSGNASRYAKSGEVMIAQGLQTQFAQAADTFTLAYGASSVVVTYKGLTSIPAGTKVSLMLPRQQKVGVQTVVFPILLAGITAADLVTSYVPGYNFKILKFDAIVQVAVTTADKLATLNLEIGTTDVTGGAIALTSANATPKGKVVEGSAITGANVGSDTDAISIEASSVTAFSEGSVWLAMAIQNLDTLNEFDNRSWS